MCMPSCLRVCEIYTIYIGKGNMQGLASRVLYRHPKNKPRQRRCADDRPTRVGDVGEAPGSLGTAGADSIIPAGRRPRQRLG